MYIESIKIGSFGKLCDREFALKEGLNVIEGGNESGKTTLSEFIKFIFYGLSNKASDRELSERKRHISWGTNQASGSLILNTKNGRYRIERSIVPHGQSYKDEFTVVDLSTNSILNVKNVGEHFLGIPEDVFTKTIYIRQAEGAYFNGESIGQAVENIFYSADESVNTDKALKKLDEARTPLRHKKNTGRGILVQLEQERDALSMRLDEARVANEQILLTESSLRNAQSSLEKNIAECEKMKRQIRKSELFSLLKKFDEKKGYISECEKYTREKETLVKSNEYNGFFPEKAYRDQLEKQLNDLIYLKKDVERFENDNEDYSTVEYSKTIAEKIRQYGGEKGVKNLLSSVRKKKKTLLTLLIFALGLALAFVPIAMFIEKTASFISGAFCGLALVCLLVRWGEASKITRLFADFGVSSENKLFEIIIKTIQGEKDEIRNNELRAYKDKNLESAQKNLDRYIALVSQTLAKWGIQVENEDYSIVVSALENAIGELDELENRLLQCEEEIKRNSLLRDRVDSEIGGYDEKTVYEEFASIEEDVECDKFAELERKYDFTLKAIDSLRVRVSELEKTLAALMAKSDRPSELETKMNATKKVIKELGFKHDAYVLAYEMLESAGASLRSKIAPGLSKASGKYMSAITDGKYKDIGVSDSLQMTYTFEFNGRDCTKEIENLSSGTKDVAYTSLRLALASLFGKSTDRLPVVFDESFARLDDNRLANMLAFANEYSSDNSQAIILTSQKREGEILRNVCGGYNHVFM